MKAATRSKYGQPDVLSIREVEKPTPNDDEVLVKIFATTVNRTDCHILWGKPFIMKLFCGFFRPRHSVTGSDFAGQIEAIGKNVTLFKVGDKVMGFDGVFGCNSHAQYRTFPESEGIVKMPANLDYGEAAACIEGAYYALEAVNYLQPKQGQNAMVIGATGAIGSSTLQFLKHYYGVTVTAVCRGEHAELVRSIGADKVIDYLTQDFATDNGHYDFVFDSVGKIPFGKCKHLLKKKGVYASSGGRIENLWLALITPVFGGKKVIFHAPKKIKPALTMIRQLVEQGKFKPVIDRKYPLDSIAEAYRYVGSGQKVANVIITIAH